MLSDLRFALRGFGKAPGFALVAILSLALGIGATTAIFTVVDAVLLRPLPFVNPGRLVVLRERKPPGLGNFPLSPPDFLDFRSQNHVFTGMSVVRHAEFVYSGGAEPVRLPGMLVSPDFFRVLGVNPFRGRGFLAKEARAAVVSYGLWQRQFGGRSSILGRNVDLDAKPYTIVGIMPRGFDYPPGTDVWSPFEFGSQAAQFRGNRYVGAIARLKPGVSIQQAQAEAAAISGRLAGQYPDVDKGWDTFVQGLRENMVGSVRPALLTLLGAVAFVLLIACVNVANLLLAKSTARSREIGIRAALGATRLRIVKQLLTETMLLAAAGAGLGLCLAYGGIKLIPHLRADTLPRAGEIALNGRVLAVTVLTTVFTGLLVGLAPALKLTWSEGGRASSVSFRGNRMRSLLVVTEVALSLVLLSGAGLLMRSFYRLASVNPGFTPSHLLTLHADLPPASAQSALDRIRALPGVASAAATSALPIASGQTLANFARADKPPQPPGQNDYVAFYSATPGYFETMRIPINGRFFDARDGPNSPPVTVISEAMAKQFFPGENPLGKGIRAGDAKRAPFVITGVVGDVRDAGLDVEPRGAMYMVLGQTPATAPNFVIKTALDPASLISAVRGAIRSVDRGIPVDRISTVGGILSNSLAQRRLAMLLMTSFAGMAFILAAIGIYGVMSYTVAQATREIGIRLALGAQQPHILRYVLSYGASVIFVGIVIGIAGSATLGRLLASQLYEIRPSDPLTIAAVSLLLIAVAISACLVPARRATRVNPAITLRYE